jgi:hypothetical protein
MIGRVGDAAFPVVDQDWHNSPAEHGSLSKHEGDYHWPLTNYDWQASDVGMGNEAEDVSATVTGFGGMYVRTAGHFYPLAAVVLVGGDCGTIVRARISPFFSLFLSLSLSLSLSLPPTPVARARQPRPTATFVCST